jgi:PIN domain nuclease of toxin-antitoxin system
VRLLLDTHVAIWAVTDSPRLGPAARRNISEDADEIVVSAVTVWEIAIKWKLRSRIDPPPFGPSQARLHFAEAQYTMLPVTDAHAEAVALLPANHGDPFDRLLVAQALSEPLRLVSADERVLAYGAGFIDARR